jgi:hypothetical protein
MSISDASMDIPRESSRPQLDCPNTFRTHPRGKIYMPPSSLIFPLVAATLKLTETSITEGAQSADAS